MNGLLLDTNIVIYATRADPIVRRFLVPYELYLADVARIEALGFQGLSALDFQRIDSLFHLCTFLELSEPVIEGAIRLRQQRRMSLGDAIIAATAIVHQLPLCTRNVADYKWIDNLQVLNPYSK